jgi:hypothetical protein
VPCRAAVGHCCEDRLGESRLPLLLVAILSGASLFLGMRIASEVGRRIGVAQLTRHPEGLAKGAGAAEVAVFGLLGLLIGFTFSEAASRFEDRRHLIGEETNAIGTAYLRVDLLPADAQPELRQLFRRYLDVRSTTYLNAEDLTVTQAKLDEGAALPGEIWTKAWAACQRPTAPPQATMLLLPALNEMIDITTNRMVASQNHPPPDRILVTRRAGSRWRSAGWLRHITEQGPELALHGGFRRHPVIDGVRDRRSRFSAARPDSRRRCRRGPQRSPEEHAVKKGILGMRLRESVDRYDYDEVQIIVARIVADLERTRPS